MWLVNVSAICRSQNDGYKDLPLARSISLSRALGDMPEAEACLQSGPAIPPYLCEEVMRFDIERIERDGRALRDKYELETIELGEVIEYLDRLRMAPPPGPQCPRKSVASTATARGAPFDEVTAVCRTDIKRDQNLYVGNRDDYVPVATLVKRAEAGEASAQNSLGRHYRLGLGGKKDPATSANWYRRAADQGLAIAQANLAYMYLNGEGVERNFEESLRWARMSADQGHFMGQMHLAYMYGEGKGVAADGRQAERCYAAAAAQGNLQAQEALVRIHARGIGVPVDRARASLWLQRVQQGRRTGRTWREE